MRMNARAGWRRIRGLPAVGLIARGGDRILWARTIARSHLVDAEFYAAQRGWSRPSVRRSVIDYVVRGFRAGLSVNPLFDELVAGRGLPEPDRVPAMYAYLVSDRRTVSVHPWWDAPAAADPDGPAPLDDTWARRATARVTLGVGERTRSVPVTELRDWALAAARAWQRKSSRSIPAPRSDSDLVLRLVQRRDRDYPRRLVEAASVSDSSSVVVGAVGCEPGQWIALDVAAHLFPALNWRRVDADAAFAEAVEACLPPLPSGTGVLCVVGPRSDLSSAEIGRLWAAARPGRAVAPVELAADGTVSSVGAAGTGHSDVYEILAGHPQEDLDALGDELIEVPLLTGPTFAVALSDWVSVGGFPASHAAGLEVSELTTALRAVTPEFTCVIDPRVRSSAYAQETVFRPSRTRTTDVFPDDRRGAERVLEAAGFAVVSWSADSAPRPRLRWGRPDPDALRWAIKICAPPGPAGAVWGDTHFAQGLASALRRRGQFVSIDSFDARHRPSSVLDDVALVVRGPYRVDPPDVQTKIEWIISHPDQITKSEVDGFDLVYAASDRWSTEASRRWNRTITPLLECTDAERFYPRKLPRSDDIVFVGTARGIARPSVVIPLAAGIPVQVYGPDWRTFIPASAIAAESIPNDELSARYETASVVLNDQWPAMQREGFIAMRPFDVVAAGGRVISEYVDGIHDVFGDVVPVFRTPEELLALLERDPEEIFPDATGLLLASERIRREHSFDARAAQLHDAVRACRAAQDRP